MTEKGQTAEFLKQIEIGSRALLMYSDKHPSAQHAIEQAFAQMNVVLREHEELVVKIEDEHLIVEGETPEKGSPVIDRLMHEMTARNIFNLTFLRGMSREELVSLMQNLNLKPQRIAELGGFEEVLKKAGIQHVQANRTFDPYDEYYEPAPAPLAELHDPNQYEVPEAPKICEELLKHEKLSVADLAQVDQALREALQGQGFAEVDALTKKVFQSLTAAATEERLAAVKALPGIVSILGATERSKNIEFSVVFVVSRCYRKESDPRVLSALLSFLLNAFEKNFVIRNFSVCEELLSTIRSQSGKSQMLSRMIPDHVAKMKDRLLEEIARKSEGAEAALQCIQLCGAAGVTLLFDRLADEEDRHARSNLINYMEHLDSDCVLSEIEARLADSRWYVVRNMITILGKMHLSECPAYLRKAAANPEARVAKEIVKILYKMTWRPDPQLILQLLQHPDKSVRLQGVHLAHRLEIQAAAPHVIAVARSSVESDLRTACLQTLLHWRVQDAIPLAETILQKQTSGRAELPERNTAVMILGELKRQEARVLLEKIAVSDPNPETRNIARSYL
jgi:HEAT repeat protein